MSTVTIPIEIELTPRSKAVMEALSRILCPQFVATEEPAAEQTASDTQLAAQRLVIGEPYPGVDGVYAGLAAGLDGVPDGHLVLLNAKPDGKLNWKDALAWADALGDGARLPTRFESALLYANLQAHLEQESWHWTGTQYSDSSAWSQTFDYGNQYCYDKSYEARCRAVRRFPA